MLIESRSTKTPHAPAERAWCDGTRDGKRCEETGPPVEARALRNKRDHDYAAGNLAVRVSGFFLRLVPCDRGRRWTEQVYCRTCALALLRELEREHAAEIAAAVSRRGAMAALSVSWSGRERVEEMQKLRAYLGIAVPGAVISAPAG